MVEFLEQTTTWGAALKVKEDDSAWEDLPVSQYLEAWPCDLFFAISV